MSMVTPPGQGSHIPIMVTPGCLRLENYCEVKNIRLTWTCIPRLNKRGCGGNKVMMERGYQYYILVGRNSGKIRYRHRYGCIILYSQEHIALPQLECFPGNSTLPVTLHPHVQKSHAWCLLSTIYISQLGPCLTQVCFGISPALKFSI